METFFKLLNSDEGRALLDKTALAFIFIVILYIFWTSLKKFLFPRIDSYIIANEKMHFEYREDVKKMFENASIISTCYSTDHAQTMTVFAGVKDALEGVKENLETLEKTQGEILIFMKGKNGSLKYYLGEIEGRRKEDDGKKKNEGKKDA